MSNDRSEDAKGAAKTGSYQGFLPYIKPLLIFSLLTTVLICIISTFFMCAGKSLMRDLKHSSSYLPTHQVLLINGPGQAGSEVV